MYQLLRHWLLGTWIAEKYLKDKLRFYLVNLVPELKERQIKEKFTKNTFGNENRTFLRVTWEDIYEFLSKKPLQEIITVQEYLREKTLGYSSSNPQKLIRAFNLETK